MTPEAKFVREVFIPELQKRYPGSYVLKQDPNMRQGILDLLFLHQDKWASFETKRGMKAEKQPNQEYYVDALNKMSFAAFVNPENYLEVLDDMEQSLGIERQAR